MTGARRFPKRLQEPHQGAQVKGNSDILAAVPTCRYEQDRMETRPFCARPNRNLLLAGKVQRHG